MSSQTRSRRKSFCAENTLFNKSIRPLGVVSLVTRLDINAKFVLKEHMNFETLGLHPAILKAVTEAGYIQPTPVQQEAIPAALQGADLLVSSQTGSGKTAAFVLPAMQRFAQEATSHTGKTANQLKQSARAKGARFRFTPAQPKMLVLTPTRELALQVTQAAGIYGAYMRRMKTVAILGGMPYPKQLQLLGQNPDILVATPGRLIDHMEAGRIDFSQLQILVLDEADRMLDMGFVEDIDAIIAATPDSRQTMLFSATLDGIVGKMAQRITHDPVVIRIATATTRHDSIQQSMHLVDDLPHKNKLLDHLLRDAAIDQAIVFTATKRDADLVAGRLNAVGFSAAALHGDMHQGARNRTLNSLRRGHVKILVATDVAARGIDVPTITHVVNFDLPKFAEDYVHRIGRTGRAGRTGNAISLVSHADVIHMRRIERFIKQTIPVNEIEGLEPKNPPAMRVTRKQGNRKHDGKRKPAHAHNQRSFAKPMLHAKKDRVKHPSKSSESRRP